MRSRVARYRRGHAITGVRRPVGTDRRGRPVTGAVAGLLLAAGSGSRYGMPKALAPVDGQPMALRALDTLRQAGIEPVIAVIGAAAEEVRALDWSGATLVVNSDWASGMGSSLRTGLAAAAHTDALAALVLLVDTPGITPAALRRVVESAADNLSTALAAGAYGGRQGHPVLLGRDHWTGVAAAAVGDTGAKPYLRAHRDQLRLVACDDIADGSDLDTPPGR